jgi:hypothetical protein
MQSASRVTLVSIVALTLAAPAFAQSRGGFGTTVGTPGAAPIGTGALSSRSSVGSSLGFTTLGTDPQTGGTLFTVPLGSGSSSTTGNLGLGTSGGTGFTTSGPVSSSTMSIIPPGLSGSVSGGTSSQ